MDFNAVLNGVGTPSMLDYATFISANAEEPGTDEGGTDEMVIESASEAHGQHHYALVSKEEWEKILDTELSDIREDKRTEEKRT